MNVSQDADRQTAERLLEMARAQIDLALAQVRTIRSDAPLASQEEYLSTRVLSTRIPYAEQTIRNKISTGEFKEGIHFVKPGRRVMFRWSAIERWLGERDTKREDVEPFIAEHHGRSRKTR
jgi:hypothetical protein